MIEDLKYYLFIMRLRFEGKEYSESLISEIATIAIKNWVDRDDADPKLTKEQFSRASRRAIAKKDLGLN
jgi:hypothetical protein